MRDKYLSLSVTDLEKYIHILLEKIVEGVPRWQSLAWKFVDLAFGPRQILFQLGLVASLQLTAMGYESFRAILKGMAAVLSSRRRRMHQLQSLMVTAESYEQWEKYALELDHLNGYDEWRKVDESSLIDHVVIKKRIEDTENMIRSGNVFDLMFKLRGGLARDQFGLQHEGLFNKAMAGTKNIVERYHRVIREALCFICDSEVDDVSLCMDMFCELPNILFNRRKFL
jgi:TAG lipase/steryl ester hydrolase/phospholipase A2/LPA acyltransferase